MVWWSLAMAVGLDDTRARAVENAVTVDRAQAAAHAARGSTWTAASGALPTVDLFASGSSGQGLTSFGFERPVTNQAAAGVTGTWVLFAPSTWAAAGAARHSQRGADALLQWARVSARREATVRIAALWSASEQARVWDEAAVDASRATEAVIALVESGLRPASDAARARARAASVRAQAEAAIAEVAAACASVQALRREEVSGRCELLVPEVGEAADGSGVHPALIAAEEALLAARARRTSTLLSRAPTVSASGTAAHYIAGDTSGFGWSAGAEARLPLLTGGGTVGALHAAAAARDDAELAFEGQQLDLAAATVAADARLRAAQRTLEALDLAVDAAEEAMTLTEDRYRQGLEALEAWLATRAARDEARAQRVGAQAARLRALAELEAVRGVW
jgi:outer membrane protein TolC